jgi:hypothetical protein
MKVEIFRRTVKDRRRGASWELLEHMAEGIRSCGDEPVIVNEHLTGEWQKDEMEPTAPIGCMFGYGGDRQMHHTKGRRRDLVERAKKRPHPNHVAAIESRMKEFPNDVDVAIGQKFFQGDEKKFYRFHFQEAIANAHAVVTHNSTASTDSCVRGIPTFCTSDLAICWPVCNKDLTRIEDPEMPDRTQWLYDLGYKMWTTDEIKDGTVFRRFKIKLGL